MRVPNRSHYFVLQERGRPSIMAGGILKIKNPCSYGEKCTLPTFDNLSKEYPFNV